MGCGVESGLLLRLLADTSILGSVWTQVYEIADLTLLIDEIHPSTLSFGSIISVTKPWASSLTLQCAGDDLLFGYSHFSLTTTSTDFLLVNTDTGP